MATKKGGKKRPPEKRRLPLIKLWNFISQYKSYEITRLKPLSFKRGHHYLELNYLL